MINEMFFSGGIPGAGYQTALPLSGNGQQKDNAPQVADLLCSGADQGDEGKFFTLRDLAAQRGMKWTGNSLQQGTGSTGSAPANPQKPDIHGLRSQISDRGFTIYHAKLDKKDPVAVGAMWNQLIDSVETYLAQPESFSLEGSMVPLFPQPTNDPDVHLMSVHIADSSSPEESLSRSYVHRNDSGKVSFLRLGDEKSGKVKDMYVWNEAGTTYYTTVGVRVRRDASAVRRDLVINVYEETGEGIKQAKGRFALNIGSRLGLKSNDGQGLVLKPEEIAAEGFRMDGQNGTIRINRENSLVLKEGKYQLESRKLLSSGILVPDESFLIAG